MKIGFGNIDVDGLIIGFHRVFHVGNIFKGAVGDGLAVDFRALRGVGLPGKIQIGGLGLRGQRRKNGNGNRNGNGFQGYGSNSVSG